jgi:probable phosphoglycerate mutase
VIAFVRHGQTEMNRTGRLQGRVDAPLTDLGRRQADGAAGWLAGAAITRVRSSPLARAVATATPIAAAHGLTVEVDDRLIELDYGEWDERGLAELSADDWARWRADAGFAPPGGESLAQVQARIASFCEEYVDEELVVAVSHVSPIKAAVCWALGVDPHATWRMFLDLASVTRVGRRGGAPYLASFNETAPAVTPP